MSSNVEFPGVNYAVKHLQELGEHMLHHYGFNDTDVSNVDQIIDALRELEFLRTDAHDRLEVETIRSSILRHKLQFLPQQIIQELSDAVIATQKSNAESCLYLKKQLLSTNQNISYMESTQKTLDSENILLQPEREHMRELHEEIISQLNQRMAEKANMQIYLNETRDKIRKTNQENVDLEDGILQLKEDLIQERMDARDEKKRLKKAVIVSTEETKAQTLMNVEKLKELSELQKKLTVSQGKIEGQQKILLKYEAAVVKLEEQEKNLAAKLQQQVTKNEELQKNGSNVESENVKMDKEYSDSINVLTEKQKQLESEIGQTEAQYQELFSTSTLKAEELERLLKIRSDDAKRVATTDAQLQTDKRSLSTKAELVGELHSQNTLMQEMIDQLAETHKAVMSQLFKQIEDCKDEIAKEKRERLECLERRDSATKELEDFKNENQKLIMEMNLTIKHGKAEHIALNNESKQLQKEILANEIEMKILEEKLEKELKAYHESSLMHQNQVDTLERAIKEMENSIIEKSKMIEERLSDFEDLEKKFDERTARYEAQKKHIAELKAKKSQLEEQIKKAKERKERLSTPQEKLRKDLKQKRNEVFVILKLHGRETQSLENEIYICGCKLRKVLDENSRLEEGCKLLSKEMEDLQYEMDYLERLKEKLTLEFAKTREMLEKSWHDDQVAEHGFAEQDQNVVDGFGNLIKRTINREQKIIHVTYQIREELGDLNKFLENLASKRPKDTTSSFNRIRIGNGRSTQSAYLVILKLLEVRRSMIEGNRLSRASSRSHTLLDLVAEASWTDGNSSF